ncbi:MAG: L-rhamnose mutarotase [Acidobacteriota bacterium]
MSKRFCLTLDLQDDPQLIATYRQHHEKIPEAITASIQSAGIEDMEIYLLGTRMFMIMETRDDFSFEAKATADNENPNVREWEALMWQFQKPLKEAKAGEKWLLMERIFKLEK